MALLATTFVDELGSGVGPASVPEAATDLHLRAGTLAAGVLVAFHVLNWLVEAPLLAWVERFTVGRVSSVALSALAGACVAAALAPNVLTLLAALAVYGPASGCALTASEGALIESTPDQRERTTARIALSGALGDLAVPAVLAGLAAVGLGWRWAFGVAAVSAAAVAVIHARAKDLDRPLASSEVDDAPASTWRSTVTTAWSSRGLFAWAFGAALTTLLDEIFVAFGMVHLQHLGATALLRSVAVGVWIGAGLFGLVLLERISGRGSPTRLARIASLVCIVGLVALAATHRLGVALVAFAIVGVSGSMLHPLAKARAYAALPGRPAIVGAVENLLSGVDLLAPVVLGVLAARIGAWSSVGALLIAPVGIWLTARRFDVPLPHATPTAAATSPDREGPPPTHDA